MNLRTRFLAAIISLLPIIGFSQRPDSVINKLDSLKKQTDTVGQVNLTEPGFYDERAAFNAKVFGTLLLGDFK